MTPRPLRRRVLRAFMAVASLGLLFVAVIGFAHTETGRPLLRYIPGMGACPLDGANLTAADRTRIRGELLAPLAGEGAAISRRVLAFELGRTTADEVSAWATSHGVTCGPGRKLGVRCTAVPASSLAATTAYDQIDFDFDGEGRLVALVGSASLVDPDQAAGYVASTELALRDRLGAPTTSRGAADAATVSRGPLSQISREFRSSDVRAQVAATNNGHGRFTIREVHQLIAG